MSDNSSTSVIGIDGDHAGSYHSRSRRVNHFDSPRELRFFGRNSSAGRADARSVPRSSRRLVVATLTPVESTGPTISVAIPCFNAAPYIADAIASALRQSYPPLEVLVVDDGSADDSARIAESFGPPVQVFRQANRGVSAARNRAIDAARGEWIALLDNDDLWEPDKLELQVRALREATRSGAAAEPIVCVYTDCYTFRETPRGIERLEIERRPEDHAAPDYHIRMLLHASVTPSGAMIRTAAGRAVRFPEGVGDGEDIRFFLELRKRGRFLRVPQPLFGYRKRPGQRSGDAEHTLLSIRSRYEWFLEHADEYTGEEAARIRAGLAEQLPWAQNLAILAGDRRLEARVRETFHNLHPDASPIPRCFRDGAYYRWETRLKRLLWFRIVARIPGAERFYLWLKRWCLQALG